MTDHVHLYRTSGRCLRSVHLKRTGDVDAASDLCGASVDLRRTLLDMGCVLTEWNRDELAGLAGMSGETMMVRIKPDGTMRDMRPAGAVATMEAIRRDGISIDAHIAWVLLDVTRGGDLPASA